MVPSFVIPIDYTSLWIIQKRQIKGALVYHPPSNRGIGTPTIYKKIGDFP
jgi:hypothetical protein